ncbi:MAG: SPOR domain-containing protein, partial [Pseudomonadota bacterium]|nr:SPOR domain-containing protein [Pseudomonadota bacterium]
MVLRLLFVLLMALNIAVGAWLVLGQPYAHGGSPTDPGVTELRLLSELPESSASSLAAPVTLKTAEVGSTGANSCLTLGPFATPQDLRTARNALQPQVIRMRSRQELTTQPTGWWVYLPSLGSRAQALTLAQRLGDHHINDYFVVSAGDQPNAISLGLFKEPANARNRRDEIVTAGFPARLEARSEDVPEYWLDLVAAGGVELDWRTRS